MKKNVSLIAVTLAFLISTQASAQQLDLFPEQLAQEQVAEQVQILKEACDEGYGRAECHFSEFNLKKFNKETAFNEALQYDLNDACSDWQWEGESNEDFILENSSYLKDRELYAALDALKTLKKMGMLTALFEMTPNDMCDEAESCSMSRVYVYLANGQLIIIDFDFRT